MNDRRIAFPLWAALQGTLVIAVCSAALAAGGSSVVNGKVRFQALTPTLVRMEYSPSAKFVDELSVVVVKRDWPTVQLNAQQQDGWLEVSTGSMMVRYKMDSGPFSAENLRVTWTDKTGPRSWKPGDKDDANLGGVPGDMAGRLTPVVDPGPLSRNGYFLLDDSTTAVEDKAAEWVKPRSEKGTQDWYFFTYGHDYAGMLHSLSTLIGPIPMIPKYILGTWFGSRAGYSSDEFKLIGERFREEGVPLDVFVIDSMSWTNVIWSGYDFDLEQMPDPKGFLDWTVKHGIRVTFNEHYAPLTKESDHNFDTIRNAMGLPADTKEINHDLASKKYSQLFIDLLHKPALDLGMAFWWQDGCAPANMEGLDPMMWTRKIEYDGMERVTGKRGFVFCRLGTWGSHRYGSFFTGDIPSQWETLHMLVDATQRSGNQLTAYMNSLCGGLYPVDLEPEMYERWVQFSSFSPVFWWHGMWGLRLPWEYGQDGIDTCKKFLGLRHMLLPYTYTVTRVAHETGLPLVRGMYLEYPDQDPVYSYRDQYMFGPELLVSPIVEPTGGKPALKDVYFPAGHFWYDYFTGQIYKGGQSIAYECPLDRMPIFVRAGAILPMAPKMDYIGQKPNDPLTLDVYASDKASSFRMYEDDGESLDYKQGKFAWTNLEFAPQTTSNSYTLTIGRSEGSFKGQLKSRRFEVRIHGLLKPGAVSINGRKLRAKELGEEGEGWCWDPVSLVTRVSLTHPVSLKETAVVSIENAGTLEDAIVLRKTLDYRTRLRTVKREIKLRYAVVGGCGEHAKPPRVVRETEKVETELNNLVYNPYGIARKSPDFADMTRRVLKSLVDQPFESIRAIPDLNQSCRDVTKAIADAKFEPEQIRWITATLLGLKLPARAVSDAKDWPKVHVQAKLLYDKDTIGAADVKLELQPQSIPGYQREGESAVNDSYTQFDLRHPSEKPTGKAEVFKLKATLSWNGGQVEMQRDLDWTSK